MSVYRLIGFSSAGLFPPLGPAGAWCSANRVKGGGESKEHLFILYCSSISLVHHA